MVYIMKMSVDGACRNNGYSNATAAAACVIHKKWGRWETWSRRLPSSPRPTNQAAEITAIIIALEKAIDKSNEMSFCPFMKVYITTDSRYAHGCMTVWRDKWVDNGWVNAAGRDVANRDLLERALELEAEIEEHGDVRYEWVPRGQNTEADEAANRELDDTSRDTWAFSSFSDDADRNRYADSSSSDDDW
ncbi:MAG: hypothetical protein LQ349_004383 [Xanthoria aureola]|nr:MAG: hypothetical protein LQ349_004383 [Xanthoria aureola]